MVQYRIGKSKLKFNNKTVELVEPVQNVKEVGNEIIVLFYRGNRQVNLEPFNNIISYHLLTGEKLWDIEEFLLNDESCKNKNINSEFFQDIRFENNQLIAFGFYFVIHIDIEKRKIIKIRPHL
ncbi:hypothetical protein [Pontibacillus marinus]|uniref:Uncharacterized protein n=1 Tax=Pontibacillus marinus BH030004 = DSM 16465 TaxID=1385511 RepID=A0A0A5GEC6_9BACI|nr:hypothetical protein [Pontibacillus marinus]KGX89480.1 hypothetical protein N783_06055 [Pontibacillus marinus BH030004 = DSM 16465]